MNLKEFRDSYHLVTGKASDVVRSTNYSLIAMIWILSKEDTKALAADYKTILIFIIISLGFDYLQYVIQSVIGAIKYRCDERKVADKSKIDEMPTSGYPECTPYLANLCFILKIIFAMIAMIQLAFTIYHSYLK